MVDAVKNVEEDRATANHEHCGGIEVTRAALYVQGPDDGLHDRLGY